MRGKECTGIPKDAQFIRNGKGDIAGITTGDGSFDYTPEGQEFLAGEMSFKVGSAGITFRGIYIE